MASPNFQVNFADYLRIVFQRKWWLLSLIGVSVLVAVLFAWMLPLRFQARMEVEVRLKHRNNPYLKQEMSDGQMEKILGDLRGRSKNERRLDLMVRNLRLAVKNNYCRESNIERNSDLIRKDVSKRLSDMSTKERQLFVRRLELVTLARIVGILDIPSDPFIIVNCDTNGGPSSYSEYLIDERNDIVFKQIAKALMPKEKADAAETSELREILARRLDETLSRKSGVLADLNDPQIFELYKEFCAIPRFKELGLLMACSSGTLQGFARSERARIASMIRSGLYIGGIKNGRVTFTFDSAHKDKSEAIPHIMLDVVYNMLVAEYYAIEEGNYYEARDEMIRKLDTLKERELEVAKQIFHHKDMLDIQKALQEMGPANEMRLSLSSRINPDLLSMPQVTTHIRRINAYDDRIAELRFEIGRKQAEWQAVRQKLENPELRKVRKTISSEVDQKSISQMMNQKTALESQLRILLFRCTPEHPNCKKLIAQIDEIAQALKNQSTPVVVDTLIDNPMIQEWEHQAQDLEAHVGALDAEIEAITEQIKIETVKALDAPEAIQEYNALQLKSEGLKSKIAEMQKRLDDLEAQHYGDRENDTLTSFEVASSPVAPHEAYAPNRFAIVMLGMLIGGLAAIMVIFFIEYTDHSIKDGEEVKYYFNIPVLGTIPEYSFQQSEELFANEGMARRKTPPDKGVHGSIEHMLRLAIILVAVLAIGYFGWKSRGKIKALASQTIGKVTGIFSSKDEAEGDASVEAMDGVRAPAKVDATSENAATSVPESSDTSPDKVKASEPASTSTTTTTPDTND